MKKSNFFLSFSINNIFFYIRLYGFLYLLFINSTFNALAQTVAIIKDGSSAGASLQFLNLNGNILSGLSLTKYGEIIIGIQIPVGGNAICDGVTKTVIVETTSKTGKIWMDRNLGASQAATSTTDYYAYGCLYQWGRGNDGHASVKWTSPNAGQAVNFNTPLQATSYTPGNNLFISTASGSDWLTPQNNNLWQGISGINNPCPTGYRIPTISELTSDFTFANNIVAYAGNRFYSNGIASSEGTDALYWSSSTVLNSPNVYYTFSNSTFNNYKDNKRRDYGYSVRCIKNY